MPGKKTEILTFCCPRCDQKTRYHSDQNPWGRTKKCKQCEGLFFLNIDNLRSKKRISPKVRSPKKDALERDESIIFSAADVSKIIEEEHEKDIMNSSVSEKELQWAMSEDEKLKRKRYYLILTLGGILSLIILSIFLYNSTLFYSHRFTELAEEYRLFEPSTSSVAPVRGKVLIVTHKKGYSPWTKNLPENLVPLFPEEVGVIAIVHRELVLLNQKYNIDPVNERKELYGYDMTVKIIDREKQTVIAERYIRCREIPPSSFLTKENTSGKVWVHKLEPDETKVLYFIAAIYSKYGTKGRKIRREE